jgi:hypothetical protein
VSHPEAFTKSGPPNGATNQPVNPTLSWGTSNGAASYEYCYDTTNDGACSGSWTNTGASLSVNLIGLSPGATYHWQVRAVNEGGITYSDNGTWWSFTTRISSPGVFNKTSPSKGVSGQPTNLTLSWETGSNVTSYEYCYDTTNNNTCDGIWTTIGTNTYVDLSGLSSGTTYYWQVRALNDAGSTEANDESWWEFTTFQPKPHFYIYLPMILR